MKFSDSNRAFGDKILLFDKFVSFMSVDPCLHLSYSILTFYGNFLIRQYMIYIVWYVSTYLKGFF